MSVIAREPGYLRLDRYLLDRALDKWTLTPLRITLIYLVMGFAALYFSDVYLVQRFGDPLLSQLQAVKGVLEVVLTGALILGLTGAKTAQLERTRAKIERQNEELHVLHRVLRHNLRNDLTVVIGISEELIRELEGPGADRQTEMMMETATRMLRYTEQASRIRRVTARKDHQSELDLAEEIPAILERIPIVEAGVDVRTQLPATAPVKVNHMFGEAVEELVRNAIEHNDSPEPRVEVTVDRTAGPIHLVEICVSDNGSGIPDKVVSVLKESEVDQLSHLQGMGLWFVHWVVAESDGHMIVDENADGGALVRVRVPTASLVMTNPLGTTIAADMSRR